MEKPFLTAVMVQKLFPVKLKFILDQFVFKFNSEELEIKFNLPAHMKASTIIIFPIILSH